MKRNYEVFCDPNDMLYLNPHLLLIFSYIVVFCYERGLPCNFTSMVRHPGDGISTSTTHQEGRAFDLSLRDWAPSYIEQLEEGVSKAFDHIGAISSKTLTSRPIYVHPNAESEGYHAHLQVRKGL